ncbi:MAG: glycine betaine ABC transporter substrate-binding protein [Peptostreptococcaceae bacterium]|nr:glycine betaine ABC transporter substrate-binding protein [Peptostreptococcaceae bacterium]
MKKQLIGIGLLMVLSLGIITGCGAGPTNETKNIATNTEEDKVITFGTTGWTSTQAPTAIVKLILEEAGYTVKTRFLAQPIIFEGLKTEQLDFFMDAWLPYTEAALWKKYKADLIKVSASYKNAPLGWVVPSYVEENSIEELKGKASKFGNRVVTISPGAGIVEISKEVMKEYNLDDYTLLTSSETAMLAEAKSKMSQKEPIVFTSWRPHSMFAMLDLKFLEDPKKLFKSDNVYVISYKNIKKTHPKAYKILSKWSIEISDLEQMMLEKEKNEVPFEESAKKWITEHREQVDQMLAKE